MTFLTGDKSWTVVLHCYLITLVLFYLEFWLVLLENWKEDNYDISAQFCKEFSSEKNSSIRFLSDMKFLPHRLSSRAITFGQCTYSCPHCGLAKTYFGSFWVWISFSYWWHWKVASYLAEWKSFWCLDLSFSLSAILWLLWLSWLIFNLCYVIWFHFICIC